MNIPSKRLGVIVGVDGGTSQVGMYSMANDAELLWYGSLLTGPQVGALLTIKQDSIKIIASVSTEKIIDQQNTIRSTEFDNRYSKNSINRIVTLKTKGVIENGNFSVTSKYVPMVGNEVILTSQADLEIVYGVNNITPSIQIGTSVVDNQKINLSIDKFFASHIGIFGNTGSGKSNTLHKLYLELFRSDYRAQILEKSQFFVIDFNGEYTGEGMFGIDDEYKKIFEINTRQRNGNVKLPVKRDYLFDADVLAILFDAKPATQVPFLRNALRTYNEQIKDGSSFANLEIGLIVSILKGIKQVAVEAKDSWINAGKLMGIDDIKFQALQNLVPNTYGNEWKATSASLKANEKPSQVFLNEAGLDVLKTELENAFNRANEINKLSYFLEFQKVFVAAWRSTNIEFINPLFHRMHSAFESLSKVIEVKDTINKEFRAMNIVSLVNANQEITRLVPMLISKMIYDEQKEKVSGGEVIQTRHLIIDEAHNILNAEYRNNGDDWQDFRLSVFEEIIKEGRKFGFFLTLASQRPADISPTIISQIHNYFIHRVVNEKDLKMLENTMPTLDNFTRDIIPSLGKGEVIVTGTAMQIPVVVQVPKEKEIRPSSDDVKLTDLWKNEPPF